MKDLINHAIQCTKEAVLILGIFWFLLILMVTMLQ